MDSTRDRPSFGPVVAAALAAFGVTALLLPSTPGRGDSAELTLALALAGVPHPTGYPLYVLAGHLFVRLAHQLGASWALAANAWSAAGAAVAVGACARLLQHLVAALEDEGRPGAPTAAPGFAGAAALALPLAALALNPVWVESATVAEVYSWNNALIALAAAFAIGRLRSPGSAGRGDLRAAATWGLLCGLCLAHHVTSALFLLPLSVALAAAQVRAGRWRASLPLAAALAALAPLASYGWIWWRAAHPAAYQWPVEAGPGALWMHMRGAAYTHYLGRFAPDAAQWASIRGSLLPWLIPGALAGALLAWRSGSPTVRWGVSALLAGAALQIVFVVSYGVPDPSMYFLPALMASLLAAAPWLTRPARRAPPAAVAALCLAAALALAAWSVPRALAERARVARLDAGFRAMLRAVPFERGIVLWRDDHFHWLKALQLLEDQRPALYVDSPDMLPWPARRRDFRLRFGFDALEGLDPRAPGVVERIPDNIRRQAKTLVVVLESGAGK
jgi:hypothetical protein